MYKIKSVFTMTKAEFEARKTLLTRLGRAELSAKESMPRPTSHSLADSDIRINMANEIFAWLREQTPDYDPSKSYNAVSLMSEHILSLTEDQMQHVTRLSYCTVDGLMIWIERPDEVTRHPWNLRLANGEEYRDKYLTVDGSWNEVVRDGDLVEFDNINEASDLTVALASEDYDKSGQVFRAWLK